MIPAVSSINQYQPNPEVLEVVRRLQSLGVVPTGNLTVDRQRLQVAEFEKKQQTLASNSTPRLNSLQGTENDFTSALNRLNITNSASVQNISGTNKTGLIENTTNTSTNVNVVKNEAIQAHRMIGASQLAELNKIKLGLIA